MPRKFYYTTLLVNLLPECVGACAAWNHMEDTSAHVRQVHTHTPGATALPGGHGLVRLHAAGVLGLPLQPGH